MSLLCWESKVIFKYLKRMQTLQAFFLFLFFFIGFEKREQEPEIPDF